MDYAADVNVGMSSIEGFEFKTKLILDEMGNRFPLVLYLERPATHGQNANKLMLLACKKVPEPARAALHPGTFKPRRKTAGWVTDPMRNRPMWLPYCIPNRIVSITGSEGQREEDGEVQREPREGRPKGGEGQREPTRYWIQPLRWQELENGPITWELKPYVFYQVTLQQYE